MIKLSDIMITNYCAHPQSNETIELNDGDYTILVFGRAAFAELGLSIAVSFCSSVVAETVRVI